MLSLEMLDVAIGMVFVYLLISLICTAINEFIEAKLKLRAVDLEQGIRELLNDPGGAGIVTKFFNHPLIYCLFRGDYNANQIRTNINLKKQRYSRGSDLPSYIPARNFALALMDILLPANQPVTPAPVLPAIATPSTLSGSAATLATFNDNLLLPNNINTPVNPNPLQPLRNAVDAISNIRVKEALLTIIDAAGDDAVRAREGIENWYNSGMDRVSGWYKRRIQEIMFWMGLGIVFIMNADSIAIFNNLINERPLRSAIVDAAQHISSSDSSPKTSLAQIKSGVDSLYQYNLPIGWKWKSVIYNDSNAVSNFKAVPPFEFSDISSYGQWLLKIVGWIITAFAISLGAPFWFDILNKIMVVRSTVKPTEKSPDEGSQDKQKPAKK